MSIELLEQMRAKYGTESAAGMTCPTCGKTFTKASKLKSHEAKAHAMGSPVYASAEQAFVLEAPGRTVITAPVRQVAMANDAFTYLTGRFVEADNPNGNGAYWSSADLELGAATVAGGPLNWLHNEQQIIGSLLDGRFVGGREAAADGIGNHISSTAAVWRFLHPDKALTIEQAAGDGRAFYSMECVSKSVMCLDTPGRPGCGMEVPYGDYNAGRVCSHMESRSSVRRFVDPIFLGGAAIVPPIRPGWSKANVEIVRQAAAATEKAGFDPAGLDAGQAVDLAAAILQWANRSNSQPRPMVTTTTPYLTSGTGISFNTNGPVQT
jgi:hypothetical protein